MRVIRPENLVIGETYRITDVKWHNVFIARFIGILDRTDVDKPGKTFRGPVFVDTTMRNEIMLAKWSDDVAIVEPVSEE